MKKGLISFLFVGVLSTTTMAADLPWQTKLPFAQATIHYELRGAQQGNETLYLKDYGRLRAKHHNSATTVMGVTTRTDTLELTDPDWITTFNLAEKTANRHTNPGKLYLAEYGKLTRTEKQQVGKNARQLGGALLGQGGGVLKPCNEKILGYECDVTTISGIASTSLLRGTDIPLRTEMHLMGMKSIITALRIDTDSAIPASAFTVPAGIAVETDPEAEALLAQTVHQMMSTLKRPDGVDALKQQAKGLVPAGVPLPSENTNGLTDEEQKQLKQEMEQGMEILKQMMPPQK